MQAINASTFNTLFIFLQLHIVHYNTKYANMAIAMEAADGLAVLGILIEVRHRAYLLYMCELILCSRSLRIF